MNHISNIFSTTPPLPHNPLSQTNDPNNEAISEQERSSHTPLATAPVFSQPTESYNSPSLEASNVSKHTNVQVPNVSQLTQMISHMKDQLTAMEQIITSGQASEAFVNKPLVQPPKPAVQTDDHTIEGVFNGFEMIAANGKGYPMSPNYASKSKLVEGDLLKLTISDNGRFLYKQIGPISRAHLRGELLFDAIRNQWTALAEGRSYKLLTAAVTFHKGHIGSQVTIIVPDGGESEWACIDHIV